MYSVSELRSDPRTMMNVRVEMVPINGTRLSYALRFERGVRFLYPSVWHHLVVPEARQCRDAPYHLVRPRSGPEPVSNHTAQAVWSR